MQCNDDCDCNDCSGTETKSEVSRDYSEYLLTMDKILTKLDQDIIEETGDEKTNKRSRDAANCVRIHELVPLG
eukprot:scaffold16764_cov93-Skeletonema_marinoi.AAC.2